MFTGIIRYTGKVLKALSQGQGKRFTIQAAPEILARMEDGITSIALDGSCHTVENRDSGSFTVYSSFETLKRTTLGLAGPGTVLNLELPLTPQTLLDGHLVQGHVDGMGRLLSRIQKDEAWAYRFQAPRELADYLVEKDSIAIDGISLTLYNIREGEFEVALIPQTALKTSLGTKNPGSPVNLEVNVFAKYSRRFSGSDSGPSKLEDWINSQS